MSYWTSPISSFDNTLPGQIAVDNTGNIYFPEHGGNKIAKINAKSGIMTEYQIPTGPLSITIYDAVSDGGKKLWFTEIVANKIAYLDTTVPAPFNIAIGNDQVTLDKSSPKIIDVLLTASNSSNFAPIQVDMNVTGMTDSGLKGVSYSIEPQKIDMGKTFEYKSKVTLNAEDSAKPGQYTIMVIASTLEKDGLRVSQLYPVQLTLEVPEPKPVKTMKTSLESGYLTDLSFPNIIRFVLLSVLVILIGYLTYRKIKGKSK